jgi:hypothetical protein
LIIQRGNCLIQMLDLAGPDNGCGDMGFVQHPSQVQSAKTSRRVLLPLPQRGLPPEIIVASIEFFEKAVGFIA